MIEKLNLPDPVRREFEAIVGKDFVSNDPAMLSGHVWNTGIGKVPGNGKFATVWPIALVLPASAEQVAAIVRCCLRHKLHYRAHSTGYGSMGHVPTPEAVVIDLRRMTTLEIDPQNRMAVIGPYVTAGMLQAEALKHGLTCHIIGAGPAHSPLASATSLMGVGITGQGTSMNPRNMLSWEFVNPKGEIVRGGSAGAGSGWFTSDGPGPGVRGMFRGFVGAGGGMGVFTAIGIKLYPVPVRSPLEETGRLPQRGLRVPENVGFFQAVWPSWESHRDAAFELTDENLCFAMLRMPPDHIGWTVTGTNAEYVERARNGSLPVSARPENDKNWSLITLSRSPAEHAWRVGVLQDILRRTGGRLLELEQDETEVLYRNLMTSVYVPRVLRPSGGITTSFGILDSMHFIPKTMETGEEMLREGKSTKSGPLIEGGPEEHWTWPAEGRYFWSENIVDFDPSDRASRVTAARALLRQFPIYWKSPIGVGLMVLGPLMELQGQRIGAPQDYIRAVKQHLDPTDASRSKEFIPFTVPKILQKTLPALRPVLMSEPVIRFVAKAVADKGM